MSLFLWFHLKCLNLINLVSTSVHSQGEDKHPYIALVSIATISLVFILVGSVNTLGPIVAVPFILSYASIDWAYFSLVTSYLRRQKWYSSLDEIPDNSAECFDALNGNKVSNEESTHEGAL